LKNFRLNLEIKTFFHQSILQQWFIPNSNLILTLVFTALIVANKSAKGLGLDNFCVHYPDRIETDWNGLVLSVDWSIGLLGGEF
jgi:hypothetical protein